MTGSSPLERVSRCERWQRMGLALAEIEPHVLSQPLLLNEHSFLPVMTQISISIQRISFRVKARPTKVNTVSKAWEKVLHPEILSSFPPASATT